MMVESTDDPFNLLEKFFFLCPHLRQFIAECGKCHLFIHNFIISHYLIKVKEIPFAEAVERIVGRAAERPSVFHARAQPEKSKTLLLPPKSSSLAINRQAVKGV